MMNVSKSALSNALAALKQHANLVATPAATRANARYLAAMGPTIRQMGVVPTLAIYAAGGEGTEGKDSLLPFLRDLVQPTLNDLGDSTLFDYAAKLADDEKDTELRHLQRQLESAVTAAKMAFKSFPQSTSDKKAEK